MSKKILLSGVKPTGRPHIGNYFGAMKQFTGMQAMHADAERLFMIADYHALNFIQSGNEMRSLTLDLALDYLAIGIDPERSIIFKQSDVPAHTELAWIFDTLVTVPYLMLAHAFKARVDEIGVKDFIAENENPIKNKLNSSYNESEENETNLSRGYDTFKGMVNRVFKGINVGTFNYPVLMAADILLYGTELVPVGQDQKQHIEYARDIALKFNNTFNAEVFKLPEPVIMENTGIVPGTDGRKMSKSYQNTIPLFAEREEIEREVMSIVTDSGDDVPLNVYNIHLLFRSEAELKPLYEEHKGKYKALKEALIEDIDAFIKPLREKRAELAKNEDKVIEILKKGAEKANAKAAAKLIEVKKAIGVL